MNVIEDIKRSEKYDEDILAIRKEYEKAVEVTTKKYIEDPCYHNIVVKFYGTNCSYCEGKPLYICLGCNEDLSKKAEEIENDSTKYIIDFTGEYWYDVSKKSAEHNHYSLVDYLRNLAIESSNKIPDYTDADFTCMVNENVAYIMQNNTFK